MPATPAPTRSGRVPFCAAALVTVLLAASVAACSSGGADEAAVDSTLPESILPDMPINTVAPTTSAAPVTLADTTRPPPSEAASATTSPPTAAPTTPAPATTLAPATTEPLAVQELILTGDGLGSAVFGAAPEGVIEYVTSILGGNTGDTGWVDPFAFAACQGTVARRVDWGVLSLLFTDESSYVTGREHFMGYEYGRVGQIGDDPVGLRTPGGITLGSRVVDLLAEFPDAVVNAGETDVDIPDNFYVSNVFYGLLTGITPEDYVTVLFGGYGCGE